MRSSEAARTAWPTQRVWNWSEIGLKVTWLTASFNPPIIVEKLSSGLDIAIKSLTIFSGKVKLKFASPLTETNLSTLISEWFFIDASEIIDPEAQPTKMIFLFNRFNLILVTMALRSSAIKSKVYASASFGLSLRLIP